MEKHAAGVSEDSPIGAVGSDDEGFLVALGRAAGAEERNEPGVRWVIRDDPIDCHCCVARADLSPGEADGVILEPLESSGHTGRRAPGM